jgi:hypothetical protein
MMTKPHFASRMSNSSLDLETSTCTADVAEWLDRCLNSLTAIDGHDRQYFNKLRSTVVSCRIFIRSQSLIAR